MLSALASMRALSVACAVVAWGLPVFAQTPADPAAPVFERLDAADGLPHDVVYGLAQDRTGFLWFGTQDGLARFDGYDLTRFRHDPDDPGSLAEDNVSELLVDRRGVLWVATWGGGLDRFDDDEERFVHQRLNVVANAEPADEVGAEGDGDGDPSALPDSRVQTLHEDRLGRFWVGGYSGGLVRFERETGRAVRVPWSRSAPPGAGRIWDIVDDEAGRLFVATDAGVGVLEPGATALEPPPEDPASPWAAAARALLVDSAGRLWIGTEDGLLRRDANGEMRHFAADSRPGSLPHPVVNTLTLDDRGRLWVGTTGGLARRASATEPGPFVVFRHTPEDPRSLGGADVRRLLQDRSRALWIATRGGGVSKLDLHDRLFHVVEPRPSTPGSLGHGRVTAFAETRSARTWVATSRGVYRFGERGFTGFLPDPDDPRSLPVEPVQSLAVDPAGVLWIGTWRGGLCRRGREDDGFDCYRPDPDDPTSIRSASLRELLVGRDGSLWVAHRLGLDRVPPESLRAAAPRDEAPRFESLEAFDGLYIRALFEDRRGDLWVGTDQAGLLRRDGRTGEVERFRHDPADPESLAANRIHAIFEDRVGVLWVGTEHGLERRLGDGTFRRFEASEALPGRAILAIVDDSDGFLWTSTESGLARVDPVRRSVRAYGTGDGLPASGFRQGAAFRDHRGWLYFGGYDGYVVFDPKRLVEAPNPPPVVLTSFRIVGRPPAAAPHRLREVVLAPAEDSFTFEYAALDFGRRGFPRYRHRLEGFDREWVVSPERRASYVRLDPGRYVFRVQVSNREGKWSEQGLAVDVVLRPPFWGTGWFRGGGALLFVGLLALVYRARVGGLRRRERELQARIDAAVAELRSSEERLRRAQKLESLGVLAGGVAHDFNNLLTGVLGQLDLARLDTPDKLESVLGALDRASDAAERAARLSSQMLAYSGQGAFEVEGVDLSEFVRALGDRLGECLVEIRGDDAPELRLDLASTPPVRADLGQVEQLLGALVRNTAEAGARCVEVTTALRTLESETLRTLLFHDWVRSGRFVELAVRDDGEGMDEGARERIFDPFFTSRAPGRGLGLAVVLGIVRGHGGALDLVSEPGTGTVARVFFPIAPD